MLIVLAHSSRCTS